MGSQIQQIRTREPNLQTNRREPAPFFSKITEDLAELIKKDLEKAENPPQNEENPVFTPRWTLRRFVDWLKQNHGIRCCRETVRQTLIKMKFSWKKFRKLLNKAETKAREAYLEKFQVHLQEAMLGKENLVFVDEAHFHLDCTEGYGWTVKGQRAWISSHSPGLKKLSFFGVYFYNQAKVMILPYLTANGDNTIEVMKKIRANFDQDEKITMIWDNVSYHRSNKVIDAAEKLNIERFPLPAYSPDFMPVEHLWQWTRENVTYHACYHDEVALAKQVKAFEDHINALPLEIVDRLWVKNSLCPDEEKLRFSA